MKIGITLMAIGLLITATAGVDDFLNLVGAALRALIP